MNDFNKTEKKLEQLKKKLRMVVIYQSQPLPLINGITKPMKANGYIDGSADIAYTLNKFGFNVITPKPSPSLCVGSDWVFPDAAETIHDFQNMKINFIWPNTVLYGDHPIYKFSHNMSFLGKNNKIVPELDDKVKAYNLLKILGIPCSKYFILGNYLGETNKESLINPLEEKDIKRKMIEYNMKFPVIVKPIRGRGSEGIRKVNDFTELEDAVHYIFQKKFIFKNNEFFRFGQAALLEEHLPGNEITITILPKGFYRQNGGWLHNSGCWTLKTLCRFGHKNGILPSISDVPPEKNVECLKECNEASKKILYESKRLADGLKIYSPLRIDCRKNSDGIYRMFDINVKPSLTTSLRTNNLNKRSIVEISASHSGMSFTDVVSGTLYNYFHGQKHIKC